MNAVEPMGQAEPGSEKAITQEWIYRVLEEAQAQARGGEEVGLICLALPRHEVERLLAPFREVGMVLLSARRLGDGSPWIVALAAGHSHCTYRSFFREIPCARGRFSYASVHRGEFSRLPQERWELALLGRDGFSGLVGSANTPQ